MALLLLAADPLFGSWSQMKADVQRIAQTMESVVQLTQRSSLPPPSPLNPNGSANGRDNPTGGSQVPLLQLPHTEGENTNGAGTTAVGARHEEGEEEGAPTSGERNWLESTVLTPLLRAARGVEVPLGELQQSVGYVGDRIGTKILRGLACSPRDPPKDPSEIKRPGSGLGGMLSNATSALVAVVEDAVEGPITAASDLAAEVRTSTRVDETEQRTTVPVRESICNDYDDDDWRTRPPCLRVPAAPLLSC